MASKTSIKKNLQKAIDSKNVHDVIWAYLALATEAVLTEGELSKFKVSDVNNLLHSIIQLEKTGVRAVEAEIKKEKAAEEEVEDWIKQPQVKTL